MIIKTIVFSIFCANIILINMKIINLMQQINFHFLVLMKHWVMNRNVKYTILWA